MQVTPEEARRELARRELERRREAREQQAGQTRPQADAPVTGAMAATAQPFAGFNRGVDQAFRTVSGAGRLVTDRAFEGINALAGRQIFDTSRPSVSPIRDTQQAVSGQTYDDLPVNTAYDRYAQRIGEEVGASAPALFGVGAAGQAVNAGSRGGLFGSAVNEFARRPGAYLAGDAAASTLGGAGAQVAVDVVGEDSAARPFAEMIGQIAAPTSAFAGAAGLRGAARGFGREAAQRAQGAVDDAARAGTTLTAGQLSQRGVDGDTAASVLEAAASSAPGGNLVVPRAYARQQDDVARQIDNIAGSITRTHSPEGAGQSIRQGVDGIVQRFQDDAGALFDEVDALIPASTPAPMTNARRVAQEYLNSGPSGQLGEALRNSRVETILRGVAADEPRTYQDLSRARTRVGELLNDRDLIGTQAEGALKRLYGGLSDDIADVAQNLSIRTTPDDPAFRNWFAQSQAVDEQGVPLELYHGTDAQFDRFEDVGRQNARLLGDGFYFTTDPEQAASYGDRMVRAYMRAENPRSNIGRGILPPDDPSFDSVIAEGTPGSRTGQREFVARSPDQIAIIDDAGGVNIPAGSEASAALSRANEFYREGRSAIDNYVQPFVRGARDANPEQAYAEFERAARRGPTAIRELRNRLLMTENGQQQWDDVVGVTLQRLGRARSSDQGADGVEFSMEAFLTNWDQLRRNGGLDELFVGTSRASMRDDLDAIARTAERMRGNFGTLRNPSGTADRVVTGGAALYGASLLASGNMLGAGAVLSGVGASAGTGALMTRPWFVRWLAQTTEEPVERLPTLLARLSATAQMSGDEEGQRLVDQYRRDVLEGARQPDNVRQN